MNRNRRAFLRSALLSLWLAGGGETVASDGRKNLAGKKVLFVLFDRFDESEYGVPRRMLEKLGAKVTVGSSTLRTLRGYQGHLRVRPDLLLRDARMEGYDALVFPGGYRYESRNPETYRLVREALGQSKPVAAICIAPVTLAHAGVIRGRQVTASTRFRELRAAGGILLHRPVVRDGLLITANGPRASRAFAEAIVEALRR
ncbi:DJ-1/PfpI family protein [Nitratifractor sp.]